MALAASWAVFHVCCSCRGFRFPCCPCFVSPFEALFGFLSKLSRFQGVGYPGNLRFLMGPRKVIDFQIIQLVQISLVVSLVVMTSSP